MDINCDLGESYGRFKVGNDEAIMPHISSCNIACGYHGGDPTTINHTIQLAIDHQVKIGAHPSYPDLAGFGRRSMKMSDKELFDMLIYQVSALKGMVEAKGQKLNHVKPHGALYNDMSRNVKLAAVIIDAIQHIDPQLIIYGMATKEWMHICKGKNIPFSQEIFSDRNYTDDLFLVSRSKSNALINTVPKRVEHAKRMIIEHQVQTESGAIHPIYGDTICIHGDDALAVETAIALKLLIESK